MGYIAKDTDYWLHSSALSFTLNVIDDAAHIQCTPANGAVIQVFIPNADAAGTLGYNASHGYKSWTLIAGPTYFPTDTPKYVYAAIPKDLNSQSAVIVYPSEKIDIYGQNERGEQIGNTNYYYIWLQGVISATKINGTKTYREWNPYIATGKLDTPAGEMEKLKSGEWYEYIAERGFVRFLKILTMSATSWFNNIRLGDSDHNLTGVATAETIDDYLDSDELVATPSFIYANYVSKKNDDTVEGNITFAKDINVKGNSVIDGILNIGQWLKAQWAELKYIKSPDYTGDGLADSGFLLTNDSGNGRSKLTVDELYVRVKAIFEELQVKKETVTPGNQIFSCAANIISFTRFLDSEGEDISYYYAKVPVKMKGVPAFINKIISGVSSVTGILTKREWTRRSFSAEDFLNEVSRVRCYFLAKDGEQTIENWWQSEGGHDLARCQTFNLLTKYRQTYVDIDPTGTGNVFWWRKVVGVSTTPETIDGKEYHWFDVAVDDCAEGSDIPAAGDHVSQFGNDSDTDRMNLIVIEINSEDAPAIKMYEGVYQYSLTDGFYGNPLKTRFSPKAGYKMNGSKFELVTEYVVEPIPIERGNWSDIPITGGGRTCYYYDLVQHNGASWLCVASDGNRYTVEETIVHDNGDETTTTYPASTILTQAQYDALTINEQLQCYRSQKGSTAVEPSASSPSWRVYAQKGVKGDTGENAVRLDLDNEHEDFLYNDAGALIAPVGGVVTQARLYDGETEVTSQATWSIDSSTGATASVGNASGTKGVLTVSGMTANTAVVRVKAIYKGKSYYSEFSANKVNQDKYDLKLSPNSIPYNPANAPADGVDITPSATRTDLQGNASDVTIATTEAAGNVCLYWGMVNDNGTVGNMNLLNGNYFNVNGSTFSKAGIYFELRKLISNSGSVWTYRLCDYDTVPIVKANNGASAVRLDLDNEYDSIQYQGDGNTKVNPYAEVSTTAYLYEGTEDVSNDAVFSISNLVNISNSQASISGRVVTVNGLQGDGEVTIMAQYRTKSYYAKFTVKKLIGTDKFELVVTPNGVGVNTSDATIPDTTVNVQVYRTPAGGGIREFVSWIGKTGNNYGLSLSLSPSLTETTPVTPAQTTRTFTLTGATAQTADNVAITLKKVGVTVDAETIPITHVHNGQDGAGADAVRIDLDNEFDSIPCDAKGAVLEAITLITHARIYEGAAPVTSGVSIDNIGQLIQGVTPQTDVTSGVVTIEWTIPASPANTTLSASKYTSQIRLSYNGNLYYATFVASVVKSGAAGVSPIIYQLAPTKDVFSFARRTNNRLTPVSQSSQIKVAKTEGNTTIILATAQTGITYSWGFENEQTPAAGHSGLDIGTSIEISNTNAASHTSIWVELSTGDRETIPIVKDGEQGMDAIAGFADYLFGVDAEGNAKPSNPTSAEEGKIDLLGYHDSSGDRIDVCEEYGDTGSYSWESYDENTVPDDTRYVSNVDHHIYRATANGWVDEGRFKGEDAVNVKMSPESLILLQSTTSPYAIDLTDAYTDISVVQGDELSTDFTITLGTKSHCTASIDTSNNRKRVKIDSILTNQGKYYESGYVIIYVAYKGTTYTLRFNFNCNLLGTWKTQVIGDTETSVAKKLTYGYDPSSGNVIPLENFGEYIKSSEEAISTIRKNVASYNLFTGLSDGSGWTKDSFNKANCLFTAVEKVASPLTQELPAGSYVVSCYTSSDTRFHILNQQGTELAAGWGIYIQDDSFADTHRLYFAFTLESAAKVKVEWYNSEEGEYYTQNIYRPQLEQGEYPSAFDASNAFSESQIKQTAEAIDLSITNKLGETGINIENGEIKLRANKVKFTNSDGSVSDKIIIDPETGALNATGVSISGKVSATEGSFHGFLYATHLVRDMESFLQDINFSHNTPSVFFTQFNINRNLILPYPGNHRGAEITIYVLPRDSSGCWPQIIARDSEGNERNWLYDLTAGRMSVKSRTQITGAGTIEIFSNGSYWYIMRGSIS